MAIFGGKYDLRQASPILYDIALAILEEMRGQGLLPYPVSEDEVSFIVLHLYGELQRQYRTEESVNGLLILPNYLQLAEQAAQKIASRFGEELVLTTVSAWENAPKGQEYDVVITTRRPVCAQGGEPVLISSFVLRQDLQQIANALERVWQRRRLNYLTENFPYYFEEQNFVTALRERETKEAVIRELSGRLETNGCVDSAFLESVLARETAISTGYPGFAIPHAVDFRAKQNTIAVYLSQEGILWGKYTVHAVFLMAISPDTLIDFQTLYQTLSALLLETDVLQALQSCRTFAQFRSVMLDPRFFLSIHS